MTCFPLGCFKNSRNQCVYTESSICAAPKISFIFHLVETDDIPQISWQKYPCLVWLIKFLCQILGSIWSKRWYRFNQGAQVCCILPRARPIRDHICQSHWSLCHTDQHLNGEDCKAETFSFNDGPQLSIFKSCQRECQAGRKIILLLQRRGEKVSSSQRKTVCDRRRH